MLWEYTFHSILRRVTVCQKFLCLILGITKHRFATIQKKRINNESMKDVRGRNIHTIRLSEVKQIICEHCHSISHSESHYSREKSKLNYFDHRDLSLTTLYKLFLEYHRKKTGNENSLISESTYSKYFNHILDFTFSKPCTDVCNFYFQNRNNVLLNIELANHKKSVDDYRFMKKVIGTMLLEKNFYYKTLCLEFDSVGQNLLLPKIPVSDQFYRRLFC